MTFEIDFNREEYRNKNEDLLEFINARKEKVEGDGYSQDVYLVEIASLS